MSDKASSDNAYHDEKNGVLPTEPVKTEGLAETGGRRRSVALNIVENPLRVSCAPCVAETDMMRLIW